MWNPKPSTLCQYNDPMLSLFYFFFNNFFYLFYLITGSVDNMNNSFLICAEWFFTVLPSAEVLSRTQGWSAVRRHEKENFISPWPFCHRKKGSEELLFYKKAQQQSCPGSHDILASCWDWLSHHSQ